MRGAVKVVIGSILLLGFVDALLCGKKIVLKKRICAVKKHAIPQQCNAAKSSDNYITVWIHGANLFTPNEYNLGLWPPHTFVENESLFSMGRSLVESDPVRFSVENVFMYSWSGSFNYKGCEQAAERLYDSLLKAIKDYVARNRVQPKIRIITFSYGGNIAFNLPKVQGTRKALVVDELILLAWPVQNIFVPMMKDSMFKKIFNVYSPLDIVQTIDPQGFYSRSKSVPLFTNRRLIGAANILQAKVHLNGRGCGHWGLKGRKFLSMFPQVLDQMNDWFGYCQENNLGLKRTHCILSIYTDKSKAARHKQK